MTPQSFLGTRSFLALGTTLVAGLGSGCHLQMRPRLPSFQVQAVPVSISADDTAPAPAYAAPAPAYAAPAPDEAPQMSRFEQSGGGTRQTAEKIDIGSTLLGRVSQGAPRYYAIDLRVGDSVNMKVYARMFHNPGTFIVDLQEPDEVTLAKIDTYIYESTSWERNIKSTTAKQSGRHIFRVSAKKMGVIDYKLIIGGSNAIAP